MDLWEWTGRVPFAHPCYAELMSRSGDRTLGLEVVVDGRQWLIPVISRPLPARLGAGRDLTSPYGYGGPYSVGGDGDGTAVLTLVQQWLEACVVTCPRFSALTST